MTLFNNKNSVFYQKKINLNKIDKNTNKSKISKKEI
jgi:hypothetical protein